MPRIGSYFVEQAGGLHIARRLGREYLESQGDRPQVIYPELRVLTADKPTLNRTFYPAASLRGDEAQGTGLISFTRPYPVPIIKDHNTGGGLFGGEASEVYGRVYRPAQFMRLGSEAFIRAMPSITHPEAIDAILDGRWLTVSLGSRVEGVTCSICGVDLCGEDADDCEHMRGETYDGVECLWMMGAIKAKEISFVVTPSDDQAGILNPNVDAAESAAARESGGKPPVLPSVVSRILVGNKAGIFDLETGREVGSDSRYAALENRTPRFLSGLSLLGRQSRVTTESAPDGSPSPVSTSPVAPARDGSPVSAPARAGDASEEGTSDMPQSSPVPHAAQLVDEAHRVEIDLYPLPTTATELTAALVLLEKIPHTGEERDAIRGRLAAAARGFLDPSEWQSQFGKLTSVEEGEPVKIAITAENYGLLLAIAQHVTPQPEPAEAETPAAETPAAETPASPTPDPEAAATEAAAAEAPAAEAPAAEAPAAEAPAAEAASGEETAGEETPEPEAEEALPAAPTETRELSGEATLRSRIQTLEIAAREATAHAVAFYLRALRKPQARGQGHSELVQQYSQRELASLRDSMSDLALEWEALGHPTETMPNPTTLPRLSDPTVSVAEGPNDGQPTGPTEAPELAADGTPKVKLTQLEELPEDEEAPLVFQVEEDKLKSALDFLFPNLS